jgi:hypothetical protein
VFAFWKGLSDEPEHALKALAAGSEIIRAVGQAKESENDLLAARAVVCSGKVYVGDLGAKQRSNFTIPAHAAPSRTPISQELSSVPTARFLQFSCKGAARGLPLTRESMALSRPTNVDTSSGAAGHLSEMDRVSRYPIPKGPLPVQRLDRRVVRVSMASPVW